MTHYPFQNAFRLKNIINTQSFAAAVRRTAALIRLVDLISALQLKEYTKVGRIHSHYC